MSNDNVIDAGDRFTKGETAPETEQGPLQQLREANATTLEELARLGAAPNPVMLLKLRLDILTDILWTHGGPVREMYETFWETNLNEALAEMKSQATRARLTEGIRNGSPPEGAA